MPSTSTPSSSRSASPTPTLVETASQRSRSRRNRLDPNASTDSLSRKGYRGKKDPLDEGVDPAYRVPSAASSSVSVSSQQTRHSVDSIWDFDFEAHWEWRQRQDAIRLAELKGTVPYLTFGRYEEELERVRKEEKANRMAQGGVEDGRSEAGGLGDISRGPSAIGAAENNAVVDVKPVQERKGLLVKIENNRRTLRKLMRKKRFHLIIIALVAFDLVIVMIELIVGKSSLALLTAGCVNEEIYELVVESIEHAANEHLTPAMFACSMAPTHSREMLESGIFGVNLALLTLFAADVFCSIYAFGPITYATSWVTLLDGFVVLTTLCLDIYFHFSNDPAAQSPIALVILRLWKIFRAAHAIAHALQLHYTEMMEKAEDGRKKLEWERISESIRLNCVRSTLIQETGHDIDPEEVEREVEREVLEIQRKRKEEEEKVVAELRSGGILRCRSRHGGI
ncbi:hypothetical protein JCM10212_002529 [Sporobolomyces blumeae]